MVQLRFGYARPAQHDDTGKTCTSTGRKATYQNRNAVERNRATSDGRLRGWLLCRWRRNWFAHLRGGAAEIAVVPIDDGTDGIAEIAR